MHPSTNLRVLSSSHFQMPREFNDSIQFYLSPWKKASYPKGFNGQLLKGGPPLKTFEAILYAWAPSCKAISYQTT